MIFYTLLDYFSLSGDSSRISNHTMFYERCQIVLLSDKNSILVHFCLLSGRGKCPLLSGYYGRTCRKHIFTFLRTSSEKSMLIKRQVVRASSPSNNQFAWPHAQQQQREQLRRVYFPEFLCRHTRPVGKPCTTPEWSADRRRYSVVMSSPVINAPCNTCCCSLLLLLSQENDNDDDDDDDDENDR